MMNKIWYENSASGSNLSETQKMKVLQSRNIPAYGHSRSSSNNQKEKDEKGSTVDNKEVLQAFYHAMHFPANKSNTVQTYFNSRLKRLELRLLT